MTTPGITCRPLPELTDPEHVDDLLPPLRQILSGRQLLVRDWRHANDQIIGATSDSRFRAFDSKTGKELWTTRLEYSATAVPITYQGKSGKQYVAVVSAGGGRGNNQALVVFALP